MTPFEVIRGNSPVILGFPHTGTEVPPPVWERLNENGRLLADTDWHLHRLYDGLLPNVTTVRATVHRYVIDANRDPGGVSLYPGQNTTGLIPTTDFDGLPIWREEQEPTEEDVAARLATFHAPYHAALVAEIERVKSIHGAVLLYDCHSIRSHIPFLFEGRLPDFNLGTGPRRPGDQPGTCAAVIENAAVEAAQAASASGYTSILNGRFTGGWTTRHYGQPSGAVQTIQMELAQSTYLTAEAPPWEYNFAAAEKVRKPLKTLLDMIESIMFDHKQSFCP